MRKNVKESLMEIFKTLYEAHDSIKSLIGAGNSENAISLLGDCQNTAVQIGDIIESSEGEGFCTIHLLEEYCEALYQVSVGLSEDMSDVKAKRILDKSIIKAESSVKNDIKVKKEVLFLPYKASMWDSLEGAWQEAMEDPDCDVYVVPIPYYERKPDFSLGEYHYEGLDYPKNVPVIFYEDYDIPSRRPDIIYIHNPYDDQNTITSVDPRYYSRELRKYTDCLIYIPYYVLSDDSSTEGLSIMPACVYANKVIIQSEQLRQNYIKTYLDALGYEYGDPEKRFVVGKSSKIEKAKNDSKDQYALPDGWKRLIGDRKIILYNTSIAALLQDAEQYLKKLRWTLRFFKERTDAVLWWRPHPLLRSTLKSMIPELLPEYDRIVGEYVSAGYGIFDDTTDLHRAIAYSDAYYGDVSSIVEMYKATKKPIMIQNVMLIDEINQ